MQFDHIMLDIESMSLNPGNALVLSVGAVTFNLRQDRAVLGTSREFIMNATEQLIQGREVSKSTQDWWKKQPDAAAALLKPQEVPYLVSEMCVALSDLYRTACTEDASVWFRGPQFDAVNIHSLFEGCGVKVPWKYWKVQDVRTICNQFGQRRYRPDNYTTSAPVAHKALDDAKEQVWQIWECWPDWPTEFPQSA